MSVVKSRDPARFYTVLGLVVFGVSWAIFFLTCLSFVTRKNSEIKTFQVTEEHFTAAVSDAVTRFLSSFTNFLPVSAAPFERVPPQVVPVSYAYWEFSGVPFCEIDGVRLRVGDYTNYGLILSISEERLFIEDESNGHITIFQRVHSADAPAAAGRPAETNAAPI